MKPAPTLADGLIRASLKDSGVSKAIGKEIAEARKFVLDTEASSFLADLAHAAYTPLTTAESKYQMLDRARVLSRLPHDNTWVEYDSRAFRARTLDMYGDCVGSIEGTGLCHQNEVVPRIGWLLQPLAMMVERARAVLTEGERIPSGSQVFGVRTFAELPPPIEYVGMPYFMLWAADDTEFLNWKSLDTSRADFVADSDIATGIRGYNSPHVQMYLEKEYRTQNAALKMAAEFCGEIRFIWAFLSTLNDIPVTRKVITPGKGFYTPAGRYKKFVEHERISINLAGVDDPVKLARKVVEAVRRRAHQVRGHWRKHHWKPGERIWIPEHQRGDASLGFVLHDYSVTHETIIKEGK